MTIYSTNCTLRNPWSWAIAAAAGLQLLGHFSCLLHWIFVCFDMQFEGQAEGEGEEEEKQEEERSKVDDLRGTPMSVGTLEEIIDDNHAIVSTSVGSEHYSQHPAICRQGSAGTRLLCPAQPQGACCDRGANG